MRRIIFVTGTDTGVGKTVLAASLLHHLRSEGVRALAMKPFCSGGRGDVKLLQRFQPGELTDDEVNPFYFAEPIAPWAALRKAGRNTTLAQVLRRIAAVEKRCEWLIVEGSGGLYVPLGKGYTVADVICALDCAVIVVARNRLGTINHTLLTVEALRRRGARRIKVVMMEQAEPDASAATNPEILRELLAPSPILRYPFLEQNAVKFAVICRAQKILKKVLAPVVEWGNLYTVLCERGSQATGKHGLKKFKKTG